MAMLLCLLRLCSVSHGLGPGKITDGHWFDACCARAGVDRASTLVMVHSGAF